MTSDEQQRHDEGDQSAWADVGRAVRVARRNRGLKRQDVAQRSGLSYAQLWRLEVGQAVSERTVERVAEAIGVQVSDLLELAEQLEDEPEAGQDARDPVQRDGRDPWDGLAAPPPLTPVRDARPDRPPESGEQALAELAAAAQRLTLDDLRRVLDLARRLGR